MDLDNESDYLNPDNGNVDSDLGRDDVDFDPDNESDHLDEDDRSDTDLNFEYDQISADSYLSDNGYDQNNSDPPRNEDISLSDNDDTTDNFQNSEAHTTSHATRSRFSGYKKAASTVWNYFDTQTLKYPNHPVCKQCRAVFARKTGTSTLRRHLDSHKITAPKKIRQKSLHDYRNDAYTESEQQERDSHVIRWIICDMQPFCVVDNIEWREMISTFDPRYRFHNRHTIKDRIMMLYKEKKEQVKLVIKNIPGKAAFTADMWTASNGTAFLSLTIHYIDTSWELKNFLLDIIPMSIRHSGENMADAIMTVLCEFDLEEKALALTTDNASSMLSCGTVIAEELESEFDNLSFAHYRCAAHVLNLAVGQGIKLIDASVRKVRALMIYIKSSHPLTEALKALCNVKGIPYLTPELDVKTRWNSTYYMLEKWTRMEAALKLLAADDRTVRQRYPDPDDRDNIKDTMIILKPFEQATRLLSASNYPTHGDIRFVFLGLQEHLLQHMDDEFSQKTVADAIYQKLNNYWGIMDEASQISSLLDPRTKLSAFKDTSDKIRAKNLVLNLTEYTVTSQPVSDTTDDLTDIRNYFRQLGNTNTSRSRPRSTNNITNELERYLSMPLEDRIDPLTWWKLQQSEYPSLSRVARDYLSIQATSVASEQAFSIAGKTISEVRNRLEGETARAILCLKSWIHKNIC
jgi:hypothetical protein